MEQRRAVHVVAGASGGVGRSIADALLRPTVASASAALEEFFRASTRGSIVNVSSHQAQGAARGTLPYAVAKAAIEGLTRAMAVDNGRAASAPTPSPWAPS